MDMAATPGGTGGPRVAPRVGRGLQPNQGPDRPLLLVRPRMWIAVFVVAVAAVWELTC